MVEAPEATTERLNPLFLESWPTVIQKLTAKMTVVFSGYAAVPDTDADLA